MLRSFRERLRDTVANQELILDSFVRRGNNAYEYLQPLQMENSGLSSMTRTRIVYDDHDDHGDDGQLHLVTR